jgi:hypothetical protein
VRRKKLIEKVGAMQITKVSGAGAAQQPDLSAQRTRAKSVDDALPPRLEPAAVSAPVADSALRNPDKPPRDDGPQLPRFNQSAHFEPSMPPSEGPGIQGLTAAQMTQLDSVPEKPAKPVKLNADALAGRVEDLHARLQSGKPVGTDSLTQLRADLEVHCAPSRAGLGRMSTSDVAKLFVLVHCFPELQSQGVLAAVKAQLQQRIGQIDHQTFLLLMMANLPKDARTQLNALIRMELRTMRSAVRPGEAPRPQGIANRQADVPGLKDKLLLECMAKAIRGTTDKSPQAISDAVQAARQVFKGLELVYFEDPDANDVDANDLDARLQALMVRLMAKLEPQSYSHALLIFDGREISGLTSVKQPNAVWHDFMRPLSSPPGHTDADKIAAEVKFFGNAMAGAIQAKTAAKNRVSDTEMHRWFGSPSWDANKARIESAYKPRLPSPEVRDYLEFLSLFQQINGAAKLGEKDAVALAERVNELIGSMKLGGLKQLGQEELFDASMLKGKSAKDRAAALAAFSAWLTPKCTIVQHAIIINVRDVATTQARIQGKTVDELYPVS